MATAAKKAAENQADETKAAGLEIGNAIERAATDTSDEKGAEVLAAAIDRLEAR